MKILDVSIKGNAIRLYLGKDSTDISKIYGDDWNDDNENELVYEKFVDKIVDISFPFKDTVVSPFSFYENDNKLTKNQMKSRLVPLFAICYDVETKVHRDWLNTIDSMEDLANWKNKKVIFMGDKYEDVFEN